MLDAVILVNCIVDMPALTVENIKAALQDYQDQRFPHVKYQMEKAKVMATIQYGQVSRSGKREPQIRHINILQSGNSPEYLYFLLDMEGSSDSIRNLQLDP